MSVDKLVRGAVGGTVVALAGIAGAISYSHMQELAAGHGEVGWRSHAFPLSVDGIEIVASLMLLADRRTGRRSGWLPWAALIAGTAASMAANVAVGGADPIGRVVAGWPAFALLVAIKLLSGRLERRAGGGGDVPEAAAVDTDDREQASEGGVPSALAEHQPQMSRPVAPGNGSYGDGGTVPDGEGEAGTVGDRQVGAWLPVARVARDRIMEDGRHLTRDTLAQQLRADGHPMRNSRISRLLDSLKSESVRDGPESATGKVAD